MFDKNCLFNTKENSHDNASCYWLNPTPPYKSRKCVSKSQDFDFTWQKLYHYLETHGIVRTADFFPDPMIDTRDTRITCYYRFSDKNRTLLRKSEVKRWSCNVNKEFRNAKKCMGLGPPVYEMPSYVQMYQNIS